MDALCCLPPTLEPKATDHVTDMVATIEQIMSNGHGYDVDGDVFFDVASLPGYGRLSGRAQVVAACLHNSYFYMHFVHVMFVTYYMDLIFCVHGCTGTAGSVSCLSSLWLCILLA